MLLVKIIENNKNDAILGQVRLSKGQLCPAGLEKELGKGPTGARNRGKKLHPNNFQYSSAPDPSNLHDLIGQMEAKSLGNLSIYVKALKRAKTHVQVLKI